MSFGKSFVLKTVMAAMLCAILLSGCKRDVSGTAKGVGSEEDLDWLSAETLDIDPIRVEAEDQKLSGNLKIASSTSGYTGEGYVEGFKEETDILEFTATVEKEGFYDLVFMTADDGNNKVNTILVDGEQVGEISTEWKLFRESVIARVYLNAGQHTIGVKSYWGWIMVDSMILRASEALPADLYTVEAKLSNPDSTDNTKRLMSYMLDNYGRKVLTGQNCDTGMIGRTRSGRSTAISGWK